MCKDINKKTQKKKGNVDLKGIYYFVDVAFSVITQRNVSRKYKLLSIIFEIRIEKDIYIWVYMNIESLGICQGKCYFSDVLHNYASSTHFQSLVKVSFTETQRFFSWGQCDKGN